MGLKPPSGLGPLPSLSVNRHMILGFIAMNRHRDDPTPPGRVILNSYISNIRPQVDLNLFMSIFNTYKKPSSSYCEIL